MRTKIWYKGKDYDWQEQVDAVGGDRSLVRDILELGWKTAWELRKDEIRKKKCWGLMSGTEKDDD